ncbi:MAG TPA: HAD family phosphatase [Myxococcaceae bacterium]|nr:HAD family phosphatase [Myxococcaceae bacterium]
MGERARGVVFDLDGTMVDNMRFHAEAWVRYGASLGLAITHEAVERDFAGKRNEEIFKQLLGGALSPDEVARMAKEKEALYRELYAPHVAPIAGLVAFLDALRLRGIRAAVATSAPSQNRSWLLERLGVAHAFAAVAGPESVERGKPFPDIFLAAAKALELPPEDCIAFEDAVNGVTSAARAGMRVAALTTTTPAEVLRQAGARWILADYRALPDDLAALL